MEGASGGAVSSGAPPLAHAVWMTTSAGSGPPPEAVLSAFGLSGSPVALPGGQATAWRAGAGVLKPSDVPPSVIAWQARLLAGVDGRPDFRVSVPLQAVDCSWTVEGWTAWRYEPGSHVSHRWHDIIAVGERLHTALEAEPEPAFLRQRTDPWSVADKVAWGDLPAADVRSTGHLPALVAARRPLSAWPRLMHGDLTGNVLFADGLPPLVIDLSLYWRPPAFASAIVLADALVFESAGSDVVEPLLGSPDFAQYLLRALIFRALTGHLARSEHSLAVRDGYRSAVELALTLAASS